MNRAFPNSLGVLPGIGNFRVEAVDTMDGFLALRNAWEALEGKDPEGTVFLSWAWLRKAFASAKGRWRVLAVWAGPDLVCVLPLKYRVHWSKTRSEFQTEIEAGGRLIWSEYTGFLCDPKFEAEAIAAVAKRLQNWPWVRLSLRYVLSDRRTALFKASFSQDEYRVRTKPYLINKGQTDNLSCPQVQLPTSFDAYLQQKVSRNSRQKIRRFERKYLETGQLHFERSSAAGFDRDLKTLCRLWRIKWSPVKGSRTATTVSENYRQVLTAAHELGLLYLAVLRQGTRTLGALGHVLDPEHKRVHFIVSGRDIAADGHHIGPLLHSQSIRWAIENGYEVYDFCHGNESYKYGYGAKDVRANYFSIRPLQLSKSGSHFDPLCHKEALARVLAFIESGEAENAATGSRQLLRQLHHSDDIG